MRSNCFRCAIVLASLALFTAPVAAEYAVKPLSKELAAEYKLDTAFYKKCSMVQDILIATSDKVSDHAILESAYLFDQIMGSINRDVAQRIRDRKVLCVLVGHKELTSDMPQFKTDKTGKELDFYNWRKRGFLTRREGRHIVLFAEEDVLEYEGGADTESILIHEFGHVIHGAGFDEAQRAEWSRVYKNAMDQGLWQDGVASQRFRRVKSETPVLLLDALAKSFPDQPRELFQKCLDGGDIIVNGRPTNSKIKVTKDDDVLIIFGGPKRTYAGKNRSEYFAELVQNWYDTNRLMDHDHNHILTREQLKAYDPVGAKFCEQILGEGEWRFVSPRKRAGQGHLKGFDPARSPKVEMLPHIREAGLDFFDDYWKDFWQRLHDKHMKAAGGDGEGAKWPFKPSYDKDYQITKVRGWDFYVHNDYVKGDQAVLENALKNADIQLGHVETLLPKKAVDKLKEIPTWITPGRRTAEYHWQRKWLIDNGRNPNMARAVQLTDINVLRFTRPTGPWVMLHELAHGYHDREVNGEEKRAIQKAYDEALAAEKYGQVLHTRRGRGKTVQAYAGTRMEEYFAECVEAYFGVNDYYPFVRAELRDYDPKIVEIIERVFHVNEGSRRTGRETNVKPKGVAFVAAAAKRERPNRPNIIVIMADDLGYGDTSVYDGWVKTPQLERMAAQGMTFTDFHTNSSVCSPTRAAFMTGRYQQRVGIIDVLAGHLDTPPLDPGEVTVSRLFKANDYRTALFGKWHLGMKKANNPVHHGFDEFRGYLDGYIDYHRHARAWHHNLEIDPQPGYSTHIISKNAVRFIKENKDAPYFMLVAHEAVHLPFQTPDDTPENRKPIPKDQRWSRERIRPKYKVMLEEMDKGIGEILDALEQTGQANRTLVFFFSDNGAIGAGSNKPFRGGKFSHYEGGHRVPAIAWWPGQIKPGSKSGDLIMAMDLLPTFAHIADLGLPSNHDFDGRGIHKVLLNGERLPKRKVFFGYEPKLGTAMRDGDWKLIVKAGKVQLYHLADDISERNNLAEQHPERVKTMRAEIEAFKKETAW